MKPILHLLAAVLLALGAPACGGDDGVDLEAVCDKLTECFFPDNPEDNADCVEHAEEDETSERSEEEQEACADCYLEKSCEEIDDGACDSLC